MRILNKYRDLLHRYELAREENRKLRDYIAGLQRIIASGTKV